jgi:hypothetical protein
MVKDKSEAIAKLPVSQLEELNFKLTPYSFQLIRYKCSVARVKAVYSQR